MAQMDLSSWKVVYFLTRISASDALNFPEMEIYLFINQTLTPNFYLCVPLAHGPSLPSCHVGSAMVRRRCPAHCVRPSRRASAIQALSAVWRREQKKRPAPEPSRGGRRNARSPPPADSTRLRRLASGGALPEECWHTCSLLRPKQSPRRAPKPQSARSCCR